MSGDLETDVSVGYQLSRSQVDELRETAYDATDPFLQQRNDLIVSLLYGTGVAPAELVRLDADDVDDDRRTIRIPAAGEGADRELAVDPTGSIGTRRLIASFMTVRPTGSPALFPSRKADRITVRGLRYVVDDLAERAGVRPYATDGTRGTPSNVTPRAIRTSSPNDPVGGDPTPEGLRADRSPEAKSVTDPRVEVDSTLVSAGNEDHAESSGITWGDGAIVETALDTVVDLFYVLDANGRFRRWNHRVPDVTGYSTAELEEIHALSLIAPDHRETVGEAMAAVFEEGTVETREAHLITSDGERIPYEFNGAPITDRDGDVVGLAGVGRDVTERKARERELERYRRTVNAVGDGVYQLDERGNLVSVNDVTVEVTGYDRDQLIGEHVSKVLSPGDVEESAEVIRELLEGKREVGKLELTVRTADGDSIPAEARFAVLREDGEFDGTVGVVRDVSDRKARERELAQQRDELETLARINEVIRNVDRALVRAGTREEVVQAVCDNLVEGDQYRFAWIGDYDASRGGIEPRAWAGEERGYLDDRPGSDVLTDEDVTAGTAFQADETKIARNIAEDPAFGAWRDAALERGYRSAIAVPLSYRDASHGVLCVYAPRPDAFDDRECAVLEELGETVAHALSAIERRRALVTDAVVELELRVRDPGVVLGTVSAEADCELVLNGSIPVADGEIAAYVTATGADPEAVLDGADSTDVSVTLVENRDDEGLYRFEPAPSLATDLADHGGVVREATATEGSVDVTVEFPQDVAIRTVVEALEDRYEEVAVLAHRDGKRPATTGPEFRAELDDVFTDRQKEVLEAAYLSGFFEWPRATSGEEMADTLGIAPTTFHEHVRIAQRKLFEAYFDG